MSFFLFLCFSAPIFGEHSIRDIDGALLDKAIPYAKKNTLFDPLLLVIKPLENKGVIDILFELPPLCGYAGNEKICVGTYIAFNPSILKVDEGYYVTCRAGDYKYPVYDPIVPGVEIKNKQFFLVYDKGFNLLRAQEIPPLHGNILQLINNNVQFEDTRLLSMGGFFWVSAAVLLAKRGYLPKFTLTKLNFSDKGFVSFDKTIIFPGPESLRWEKNWMHFFDDGKLRFIYSYDPFTVIGPNLDDGSCKELLRYSPTLDFSRFRGSAAPIVFESGFLMIIHELMKSSCSTKRIVERHYTHRFLYLDKGLNIVKISLPFKFEGSSVEYCTSMTLDHSEKNLIVSAGIYDSKAKLFIYDLTYVKTLLYDI